MACFKITAPAVVPNSAWQWVDDLAGFRNVVGRERVCVVLCCVIVGEPRAKKQPLAAKSTRTRDRPSARLRPWTWSLYCCALEVMKIKIASLSHVKAMSDSERKIKSDVRSRGRGRLTRVCSPGCVPHRQGKRLLTGVRRWLLGPVMCRHVISQHQSTRASACCLTCLVLRVSTASLPRSGYSR